MRKLFAALAFMVCISAASGQNPVTYNPNEVKEGQKMPAVEMINGYPAKDYYYTQTQVPQSILQSTSKEDKILVAFHNKLVAWEMTNKRPLKSLPKNDMENLMQQLQTQAINDVNGSPAKGNSGN